MKMALIFLFDYEINKLKRFRPQLKEAAWPEPFYILYL